MNLVVTSFILVLFGSDGFILFLRSSQQVTMATKCEMDSTDASWTLLMIFRRYSFPAWHTSGRREETLMNGIKTIQCLQYLVQEIRTKEEKRMLSKFRFIATLLALQLVEIVGVSKTSYIFLLEIPDKFCFGVYFVGQHCQ